MVWKHDISLCQEVIYWCIVYITGIGLLLVVAIECLTGIIARVGQPNRGGV